MQRNTLRADAMQMRCRYDATRCSLSNCAAQSGGALRAACRPLAAGIVTSLLVALLGQARVYVVLGRTRLLPAWLARVHPGRETPLNAAVFTGFSSGGRRGA